MGLGHSGSGTQWVWNTVGLEHNRTVLGLSGSGTQWVCDLLGQTGLTSDLMNFVSRGI